MIMRIIYLIVFFVMTVFFIAFPYFIALTILQHIFMSLGVIFNSYWVGYFFSDVRYNWKKEKRERHEKRFDWYRKMGLQESACLVEPEQAEAYWKWSWEW